MTNFRTITEAGNIFSKRVLLRLDLNMPTASGQVIDDFRLRRALPTLRLLNKSGARGVILSHIDKNSGTTLEPAWRKLAADFPVEFARNLGELSDKTPKIKNGGFVLLENIRENLGEEKNDSDFAKTLSRFGDIFVNEAFSVSHRAHASIVGLPKLLPSFAGLGFVEEVEHLSGAFNPPRPALLILGGAKFETKLPLIFKFLKLYERVFVGGALSNVFFKARGYEIGRSAASVLSPEILELLQNPKLRFPVDVAVRRSDGSSNERLPNKVLLDDKIVDSGGQTVDLLRDLIKEAKFVLWNGPLGEYENGFKRPTLNLAKALAESSAKTVLGGGDTLAAISELGLTEKFSFVSTGGGAMLEFLAKGTLPGIEALEGKLH